VKEVSRFTEKALNDLAVSVVRGETYLVNDAEAVRLSFGHLFGLMEPPLSPEVVEQIGAVYARYADAGPRSINGHPFFFSMSFVHKDDLQAIIDKIDAKQKALNET
jgi:hypothetical protein